MLQLESRRWLEGERFACRVLAVLKRSPSTHTHKHMHTNRYPQNVSLCPQHYENRRCLQCPDGCCKWSFSSWETNVARVTISWRSCDVSFISLPSTWTYYRKPSGKKTPTVKCFFLGHFFGFTCSSLAEAPKLSFFNQILTMSTSGHCKCTEKKL